MIVAAWTAHEVLAEDLWVKCVDERPRLAFVALNAELDPDTDSRKEARQKQKATYEVPVQLLREFNYNLNDNMGKILRDKWNFAIRERANEAYFKTFPKHKSTLEGILEDKSLRWLAAIRNVIVHASGNADREFLNLVGDHQLLGATKKGAPIPINGELTSSLIEVAMRQSMKLLTFASEWLTKHKE
jgi:hypothetical protein